MKEKEIIAKYNLSGQEFLEFKKYLDLRILDYTYNPFTDTISINDALIQGYMNEFRKYCKEQAREKAIEAEEAARKKKAMSEMLITSGFSFDGYKITKYSGYISGDDAISVDRGYAVFGSSTDVKDQLMQSLVVIRRNALRELKEAAYDLGCNAVIGVDFDYLTLDPQTANLAGGTTYQPYVFGVTANGNAVIIEKIEE